MDGHALLHEMDSRIAARLHLDPSALARRLLAQVVAHSGDSLLWMAIAAASLLSGVGTWRFAAWRILAATLLCGAVTAVLKRCFRRQRPPNQTRGLYIGPDRYAFPSGHATRTACLVFVLVPLWQPWGGLLLPMWAVAVGLARVALGIHFASDIVGGWAVGLIAGIVILTLGTLLLSPSIP